MSALATIALNALAEQAGVDAATIRAYERLGLIDKPRRAAGGLQLYRVDDITRVTFIRRTQELGFSMPAIRELLDMTDKASSTCGVSMMWPSVISWTSVAGATTSPVWKRCWRRWFRPVRGKAASISAPS